MTEKTRKMIEVAELDEAQDDEDVEYAPIAPPAEPSQVYSVRIPVARLAQLREVADRKHVRPTSLIRQWVIERLNEELTPRPVIEHVQVLVQMDSGRVGTPGAFAAEVEQHLLRLPKEVLEHGS